MRSRPSPIARLAVLLTLAVIVLAPGAGRAQEAASGSAAGRIEGSFKFLPIPYINYNRSIGFQLGGLPMAMFNPAKSDTLSPSSLAGLFGMYTSNETWFVMAFGRVHLDEDNWRITGAGGGGSVNFQFFIESPVDSWIPYNTGMNMVFVQLERRVYRRLYVGLSYIYLDFETTIESLPNSFRQQLNGLGFSLALDRRSSVYYPLSGFETKGRYFTYPEALGNDDSSDKIVLEYNHYLGLRESRDVLAGRFYAGLGLGNLSFNQQFIVGNKSDIRGYTQGEYRGNYMLALQGEYRWNFGGRFGAVGFAGVATVFDSINEDQNGKPLPSIGAGIRFTVDTETHFNVGLDAAVGLDDWGIYFRIGEAF